MQATYYDYHSVNVLKFKFRFNDVLYNLFDYLRKIYVVDIVYYIVLCVICDF